MATVVGIFHHSGDAHLAAACLLEEFGLTEEDLSVLGPGDSYGLMRKRDGEERWSEEGLTARLTADYPGEDPAARRWAHEALYGGKTLVVARTADEGLALELAQALRRTGAEPVDLIPH